jgi:hypothetical protein
MSTFSDDNGITFKEGKRVHTSGRRGHDSMVVWFTVAVSIRLYEYWHEQVKIRKKRWNINEIKEILFRINM